MTTNAPRVRAAQGAIVTVTGSSQTALVFQYNPNTVRRSLQPQLYGGEPGARSESVMYAGAPVETIDVDVEFDATDAIGAGDPTATASGIGPQLAALELLLYPDLTLVQQEQASLAAGTMEVAPFAAPLTVFVFGTGRVVPIEVTGINVQETLHDMSLNPVQAKVSLSMRVLSYSDLASGQPGYDLFVQYQQNKVTLAANATTTDATLVSRATGVPPFSGT
jgi:hypothetical protein